MILRIPFMTRRYRRTPLVFSIMMTTGTTEPEPLSSVDTQDPNYFGNGTEEVPLMKRKNTNPREYSFSHTRDRLRERYDMELDEAGYDRLMNQVRESIVAVAMNSPRARLINTENEQMTFIVEFEGREIAAVWDCKRALVTTVLPEGVVAGYLHN